MIIPVSTYRMQFNREFTFRNGSEILDYLSELSISDIYASPVFKAVKGSMHGYDVVDHNTLNPDLGTDIEFQLLQSERKKYGMGWIQDIVPNHMAFHSENMMLCSLMEHGKFSEFNDFFDIEWNHMHESLKGRLLVPFLGSFYSESIKRGEITIEYEEGSLFVRYYEHKFPLSLVSYPLVFDDDNISVMQIPNIENPAKMKLLGTLHQFRILSESQNDADDYDMTSHTKKMLWELYNSNTAIRNYMDEKLSLYNRKNADVDLERLDALLEKQMYRLSFWKVASEEINYRRFFNINSLISLRVEKEHVFNYIHRLIKELINTGSITGIRVDHVDGLCNPGRYLKMLKEISDDKYLVVEKILTSGESMPADWPVQGTTGYDFMNYLNGIYCKTDNDTEFSRIYFKFTNQSFNYDELAAEKKRRIIEKHMTGDVDNLASLLKQISGNDMYGRDITMQGLRSALVEVIAFFPVYRTYINSDQISNADLEYINTAFSKARKYTPEYSFEYDFLEKCLTLKYIEKMDADKTEKLLHFIMRFQQYTGPFMAKGFEDTVLYIANRLISLNEVGGSPGLFGITLETFHDFIRIRAASHKHSMNATSTHDSKRGEDVRCRINVLSELPGEWKSAVSSWSRINHAKKRKIGDEHVPDKNDEYFIYQTLTGTFPSCLDDYERYVQRICDYMIKSVREAKIHTAWIKPDAEYEDKLLQFINRILLPARGNSFLERFIPFQKKIAYYGILNSLSQIIVKTASPGVPDFYQGTELWDLRLVDPDNRKKVDFRLRKEYMEYIAEKESSGLQDLIKELWETRNDGRIKLFLIRRLLHSRLSMKELFSEGDYMPLEASGKYKNSIIAFMRTRGNETAIAVAPRFMTGIAREDVFPAGDIWNDTEIILSDGAEYKMRDAVTGREFNLKGSLMLRDILDQFPGALLTGFEVQ